MSLADQYPLLAAIDSPAELRRLSTSQLEPLTRELREFLVQTVSQMGGHFAAGLGTVELTLALHRIFNSPEDKILWDVGHQAYAHKILTGRRDRFPTLRQEHGISGFTRRDESPHDPFGAAHAGTAISAAVGMAEARALTGGQHRIVAVVGDGALTSGMVWEGLNRIDNNLRLLPCQAAELI